MLGKFQIDKISKDTVGAYMTMLESEAGIMPRAIHHIFQGLQRQVLIELNYIWNLFPTQFYILVCWLYR